MQLSYQVVFSNIKMIVINFIKYFQIYFKFIMKNVNHK
jgi:hypothetical protein